MVKNIANKVLVNFCVANEGLGKRNPQQVAGGQICNFCKFVLHGETCSWNVTDE